jgi:hypothetical protein
LHSQPTFINIDVVLRSPWLLCEPTADQAVCENSFNNKSPIRCSTSLFSADGVVVPAGPSGLFKAGDWPCVICGNINWSSRTACNRCNEPKPGLNSFEKREASAFLRAACFAFPFVCECFIVAVLFVAGCRVFRFFLS